MVSFKRLRNLRNASFVRHLVTLPQHFMSSLGTGLYAGQIAVRLAGLGTAVAIGATGALTAAGSLIVGAAGGIVGLVAITAGLLGLAKEHRDNTETLKVIVGSDSQTGQDEKLKMELAKLAYNADRIDEKALGEILYPLHAIEGENLTEKLCNLFGAAYFRSHETMKGYYQIPANTPTPQHLLAVKILEAHTNQKIDWHDVPNNLIQALTKFDTSYNAYLNDLRNDLSQLLDRRTVNKDDSIKFLYDKKHAIAFMNKLSQLPGENLKEKLACLFSINPAESITLKDFISQLNVNELEQTGVNNTKFSNIPHLTRVIRKIAQDQYFDILTLKSKGVDRENPVVKELTAQFKSTLSLIEGEDYHRKLDTIFNVGFWERSSSKFKESAMTHSNTSKALLENPELIPKLLKAKQDFDYDHSDVFFRPLSYLQDFFIAFSGSLTGFGIVTALAAFVGVGIATSGIGLGILIGALASAVIGFGIAYYVRRYTKAYTEGFKKETEFTTALIEKTTEKAKEKNTELALKPTLELAKSNEPRQKVEPQPSPKPAVSQAVESENHLLRQQLAQQQEEIERLRKQVEERATSSAPRPTPESINTAEGVKSSAKTSSSDTFFTPPTTSKIVTTAETGPHASGKRAAPTDEPTSPPPPDHQQRKFDK
jgi:hypothetical protein